MMGGWVDGVLRLTDQRHNYSIQIGGGCGGGGSGGGCGDVGGGVRVAVGRGDGGGGDSKAAATAAAAAATTGGGGRRGRGSGVSFLRRRRGASAKLHVRVRGTVNQISQGLPVPAGLPDASFASVGAEHTGRRPSLPLRVAMSAGFFHGMYGRGNPARPHLPARIRPPPRCA